MANRIKGITVEIGGDTELLAQKHKLLGQAVEETKGTLTTLKTAAEQANTALANGESSREQYDALQREIIETEQELKNWRNRQISLPRPCRRLQPQAKN